MECFYDRDFHHETVNVILIYLLSKHDTKFQYIIPLI